MTKKQDRVYCSRCTCPSCQTQRDDNLKGWPELGLSEVFGKGIDRNNNELSASVRKLFRRYRVAPAENELNDTRPASETNEEADWRPTADDWMKLALALAIAHREPGFHVSQVRIESNTKGGEVSGVTMAPQDGRGSRQNQWQLGKASEKWLRNTMILSQMEMGKTKLEGATVALEHIRASDGYEPADKRSNGVSALSPDEIKNAAKHAAKHYLQPSLLPPGFEPLRYYNDLFAKIWECGEYLTDWERRSIERPLADFVSPVEQFGPPPE